MNKRTLSRVLILVLTVLVLLSCFTGCNSCDHVYEDGICTLCGKRDSSQGATKTITTLNGKETSIPINPKRIVTLTNYGDLYALGFRPVATTYAYFNADLGFAQPEGCTVLKNSQPFDEEEILACDPDLIIVYEGMSDENIAKLEMIAPVLPIKSDVASRTYEERLTYLGEVFSLQEKAQKVIDDTDKIIADAITRSATLNMEGKTINVFNYYEGLEIISGQWYAFHTIIYDDFGYHAPAKVEEEAFGGFGFFPLSSELLPDYTGDYIFLLIDPLPADILNNQVWLSLPAVQAEHVSYLDMDLYLQSDVWYLQAQYTIILDALEQAFGTK